MRKKRKLTPALPEYVFEQGVKLRCGFSASRDIEAGVFQQSKDKSNQFSGS